MVSRIENSGLEVIRNNEDLFRFASAGGESLYKVNCSQCHGSGAQGASGIPNLSDDDWLWGGDLQTIYDTIKHGVRNEDDEDARQSQMPGFGEGILEPAQINNVTQYVLQLAGQEHEAAQAKNGAAIFADNCAACHGDDGRGRRDFGAPNLADSLWLYGGSAKLISAQINKPKHGVMPAWGKRLNDAEVKQLAIYVHSLGGGEKTPVE
jgi:cytochrome c oxidase cbb3-type subunit 3